MGRIATATVPPALAATNAEAAPRVSLSVQQNSFQF